MSELNPHLHVLILAGGEGSRFYPLSTPEKPKQFLNFIGRESFLRQTFERVLPLCPVEKIFVSTNERYVDLVREQLPEILPANIIPEPHKRNTAPAIAYAAALMRRRDAHAVMCCLPSDHHIEDEDAFRELLARAADVARDGYLVTLGMKPTWPSPDYGYICPKSEGAPWSEVERFVEKPEIAAAERYIGEGYLWNSGIFAWSARSFQRELVQHAPEVHRSLEQFEEGEEFLRGYFRSAPSISVDHAVLEKSGRVAVLPAAIGWSDVGTWEGVKRLMERGVDISTCVKSVLQGDDVAPWRCIVPKPWGHEELWALTSSYAGKILFIRGGCRVSLQYHRCKEETLRALSGAFDLELDGGIVRRMKAGDVQHIPPGTRHRLRAAEDSLVLEVSTTELDDVVRLNDDYGRCDGCTTKEGSSS